MKTKWSENKGDDRNNIYSLVKKIKELEVEIQSLKTNSNIKYNNKNHFNIISNKILNKTKESFILPNNFRLRHNIDYSAGIKHTITKISNDIISYTTEDLNIPNFNPNSKYIYKLEFFIMSKSGISIPIFDENTGKCLLGIMHCERYLPKIFYETIDTNENIDVYEFKYMDLFNKTNKFVNP